LVERRSDSTATPPATLGPYREKKVIHSKRLLLAAAALSLAACKDATSPNNNNDAVIEATFLTAPAGFAEVNSSFAPEGAASTAFMPGMERGPGPGLAGPHGPRGGFAMMGGPGGGVMGGLHLDFVGGIPFGRGPRHGPLASNNDTANCVFSSTTGDITCTNTRNGLTITRVLTYKTADGTAQQAPNDQTFSARTRISVEGTVTRREGATSTIEHESDRTVTGLDAASTQRTVNGTATGTENTTGTNREGKAFTALREVSDAVVGVIIPLEEGRPTYPTAGTITREMNATITIDGTTTNRSRKEVITFDGSNTATVVITVDGTSKTCTLPLPRGRMTCQQ
jgi:hypothetical protein